jgi:hypothetical protein
MAWIVCPLWTNVSIKLRKDLLKGKAREKKNANRNGRPTTVKEKSLILDGK